MQSEAPGLGTGPVDFVAVGHVTLDRTGSGMNMRFGTAARILLGLVVSALCLWLAVRQAPLDELVDALRQVNYWWIVPSVSRTRATPLRLRQRPRP